MGFLKRMAGFLGFGNPREEETHHEGEEPRTEEGLLREKEGQLDPDVRLPEFNTNFPRRGFSVPVVVEKPKIAPVIVPCENGDGGIQGFNWYRDMLRIDEDGDVADEFLFELPPSPHFPEKVVIPDGNNQRTHQPFENAVFLDGKNRRNVPQFQVNNHTERAPVSQEARVVDGNVQHYLEYNGCLRWV